MHISSSLIPEPGNLNIENWLENRIQGYSELNLKTLKESPVLAPRLQHIAWEDLKFDTGLKVTADLGSVQIAASADFAYTESTYSASKIAGEAFVYSYARCYGLKYLVFRFSNVYGRYDNDLARMVRVLPLFIHTMLRDEPVTVFGQEKTLDFTYVDDCIDGITRGIEALADGRVVNETVNLAYGQGNSLVHAAELIAAELGTEPKIALAPSLLGEVTHYVADLTKARELLGYEPAVPLEEGISRSVAWFKEHRAAHPEEDGPLPADVLFPQDAEVGWKSAVSSS